MRALALVSLLLACAHATSARPPADASERERIELASCLRGVLPPWLDDGALAEAGRADRWGAVGMDPNDSYRVATAYSHQAPLPRTGTGASSRQAALLEERSAFQTRCSLARKVAPLGG